MGNTLYDYAGLTTTVTSPEGTTKTTLNAAGQTVRVETNGKGVTYTYYPSGLTKTATPDGNTGSLTMEYDLQGNRTKLTDPDAGIVESLYDGWGQLTYSRQKVHSANDWVTTNYYYLDDGRLNYKQTAGKETTRINYAYDSRKRVSSIEIPLQDAVFRPKDTDPIDITEPADIENLISPQVSYSTFIGRPDIGIRPPQIAVLHRQTFTYDNFDRVLNVKEEIDGKTLNFKTVYNAYGQAVKDSFPSGYFTVNHYDYLGNLYKITDSQNRNIWELKEENAKGQTVREKKGNKETTYGYDSKGFTTSIKTPAIDEWEFFYTSRGNLDKRVHQSTGQMEMFAYDNLDRLIKWGPEEDLYFDDISYTNFNKKINYDSQNNIGFKSDIGYHNTMSYGGNGKPHALTSITGPYDGFDAYEVYPTMTTLAEYTDFKKIKRLMERDINMDGAPVSFDDYGNELYASETVFTYGVDEQRRKMESRTGADIEKTYYFGNYEEKCAANGTVLKKIHYLRGAVLIQNSNGTSEFYYTYADNLGSLTALANENGTVAERYAYDPWGNRRNPSNWTLKDERLTRKLTRGYTGHEHLDFWSIINMNGRLYDPVTAQFFSPDPALIAGNWLSYNRYSYAMGNPFKYTDPSGDHPLLIAMLVGAAISAAGYTANIAFSDGGFDNWNWGQFGISLGIGAISGVATYGIGSVFGEVGSSGLLGEVFRASTHGFTSGVFSGLQGGSFSSGFWTGAVSSLAGSALQYYVPTLANNAAAVVGFSALSGGIGAELTGGDFWKGAATGAMIGLLNHGSKTFYDILSGSWKIIHSKEWEQKQVQRILDVLSKTNSNPSYKEILGDFGSEYEYDLQLASMMSIDSKEIPVAVYLQINKHYLSKMLQYYTEMPNSNPGAFNDTFDRKGDWTIIKYSLYNPNSSQTQNLVPLYIHTPTQYIDILRNYIFPNW